MYVYYVKKTSIAHLSISGSNMCSKIFAIPDAPCTEDLPSFSSEKDPKVCKYTTQEQG